MVGLRTFSPMRHPPFRRIFASQVVSGLGDWLDYVGLLTLVAYVWKSGAFSLACLTIAMAVPWIVIAPLSGVWADRLPARALMVGSDLVRAVCVLLYLVAGNLPVLLLLVMCKTTAGTFFSPAERRAVRALSGEDELHSAVALTTFTGQATKVVGPALGGLLVAGAGPHGAFVADSVSFVLSAAVLWGLRVPTTGGEPAAAGKRGFRREFREGLSFLVRSRPLLMALAGMTATIFLVFTFDTLSPLTLQALGVPSSMLGFAIAGIGLVAVLGTMFIGQWGDRVPPLRLMSAAQLVVGLFVALVGVAALTHASVSPVAWLAGAILTGVAAAAIVMSFSLTLQRETPQPLLGRVSGAAEVVPTVMQLAAPPIGAAVATGLGVGWVLAVAGGCLAAIGIAFGVPSRRLVMAPVLPVLEEADVVAHMAASPHPDAIVLTRPQPPSFFL
jgi:MFS family permease